MCLKYQKSELQINKFKSFLPEMLAHWLFYEDLELAPIRFNYEICMSCNTYLDIIKKIKSLIFVLLRIYFF